MPIATRTFHVFVSSTIEDLKLERDALHRQVFLPLEQFWALGSFSSSQLIFDGVFPPNPASTTARRESALRNCVARKRFPRNPTSWYSWAIDMAGGPCQKKSTKV